MDIFSSFILNHRIVYTFYSVSSFAGGGGGGKMGEGEVPEEWGRFYASIF